MKVVKEYEKPVYVIHAKIQPTIDVYMVHAHECNTHFHTPNVSRIVLAFVGILNSVDCQDLETHLASQLKLAMVSLRIRSE